MTSRVRVSAFTLAEVLITLGIIGIVAALTMPSLIAKHQKQVTLTTLKKTYSVFSQAITSAVADNGEMKDWEYGSAATPTDRDNYFNKYLKPYVKTSKLCLDDIFQCWANKSTYLNGSIAPFSTSGYSGFVLNDGTSVIFRLYSHYAVFYIDVNGKKGPNRFGRDIFRLTFSGNTVRTCDTSLTREELMETDKFNPDYICSKNGIGEYCSGLIQVDGWEIRDDYPW